MSTFDPLTFWGTYLDLYAGVHSWLRDEMCCLSVLRHRHCQTGLTVSCDAHESGAHADNRCCFWDGWFLSTRHLLDERDEWRMATNGLLMHHEHSSRKEKGNFFKDPWIKTLFLSWTVNFHLLCEATQQTWSTKSNDFRADEAAQTCTGLTSSPGPRGHFSDFCCATSVWFLHFPNHSSILTAALNAAGWRFDKCPWKRTKTTAQKK